MGPFFGRDSAHVGEFESVVRDSACVFWEVVLVSSHFGVTESTLLVTMPR